MDKELITAGQFAKAASTTKRTIDWYTRNGLLVPVSLSEKRYRLYSPEQIIDFQVILLLRHLNFSLDQIKDFLSTNGSFKDLFLAKRTSVLAQLAKLRRSLDTIDMYYQTFSQEGVLVKPVMKQIASQQIYYLQKEGPYSKIYQYDRELRSFFLKIPKDAAFLTVYEDAGYRPVKSKFQVGVLIQKGMKLTKEGQEKVVSGVIPAFFALSYTFTGNPSLLSLHWKQLEKYAALHNIERNTALPFADMEIYHKSGIVQEISDEDVVTEILLPVIV